MAERLFLFVQLEFPWELGPADGRYLVRARPDGEPERVVVLGTLGASRAAPGGRDGRRRWPRAGARRARQPASPEPAPVSTTRVTSIDPISLPAERQAQAWLTEIDADREIAAAVTMLNRVLQFHRVATADPYVHEVSPDQALVIRAGFGEGEQVAEGAWRQALELPWSGTAQRAKPRGRTRRRDRSAALAPQERLAALLGAHDASLLCEELALRARLDLDLGRAAHAAIQLDAAVAAALDELRADQHGDLPLRLAELRTLHDGVAAAAQAALHAAAPHGDQATSPDANTAAANAIDEATLTHALERLEAALRARSVAGYGRR